MDTQGTSMFNRFIGNVFGGLFLMLPLAVVVIIALKIYQIAIVPTREVAAKFGIERPYLIHLLLLVIVVILCFISGVLMHKGRVSRFKESLESNVLRFVPGYEYIKMRLAVMVGNTDNSFNRAVMVKIDDGWSPAMLIEKEDSGRCTVFVPDVPKSNSGSVYIVEPEQVKHLKVNFNQLDLVIRNYGKGLGQIVREAER